LFEQMQMVQKRYQELTRLLADPAAARTRAENARQNLCSHFTWQAVFATMMEAVTSAKRS